MKIHHELLSILVAEEIEQTIARAARGCGFIRAGEHAYRLSKAFPNCGMTGAELVNELVAAAAKAGVAVDVPQPSAASAVHEPVPVAA